MGCMCSMVQAQVQQSFAGAFNMTLHTKLSQTLDFCYQDKLRLQEKT